jgi:hypothetical protein
MCCYFFLLFDESSHFCLIFVRVVSFSSHFGLSRLIFLRLHFHILNPFFYYSFPTFTVFLPHPLLLKFINYYYFLKIIKVVGIKYGIRTTHNPHRHFAGCIRDLCEVHYFWTKFSIKKYIIKDLYKTNNHPTPSQ